MDFFSLSLLVALLAFATGIAVGLAIYKFMHSDDARARKLEDELIQLKQEHQDYKQGVTEHFSKTSDLVNNLTEDYVKVYKHLAESAESLTDVKITPQLSQPESSPMVSFINEVENNTADDTPVKTEESVEPPKDYAPKNEGDGTLSESFSVGSKKPDNLEKKSA